ncbi:MAG: amidase family protein [Gammaproteobacteria bacterium]|jgi:amidase
MRRRRFLGLAGAGTLGAAISWQQSLAGADDRARAGDFDPTERSIADLQNLLGGSLTSAALVTAYLARIARLDAAGPAYRSVLAVNPDALAAARALDAERRAGKLRGPLHGIPILIKDNIATRDPLPTTAGSYALARAFHRTDAALVARLRAAGAVVLGKTNLSEWANFRSTRSSSGWSAVGGQTGNAYDVARNPSGSSSGSGTAAALSLCAAAVGTETDGSILSPAAVNGLVGFKPSLGVVSGAGVVPLSPRQDVAGPMARSVADARTLVEAMYEPARPRSGAATAAAATAADTTPRKLRIGLVPAPGNLRVEVAARYRAARDAWRDLGAEVIEAPLPPTIAQAGDPEFTALLYEFKAALDAYLGTLAPGMTEASSLAALIDFNRRNADRELPLFGQEILEMAAAKGPLTDQAYLDAVAALRRLVETEGLEPMFRDLQLDALVAPGAGPAALIDPLLGDRRESNGPPLGSAAAIAGYPSITLPMGLAKGMPVGMTVVAPRHAEDALLDIAARFERESGFRTPPPKSLGA